MKTFIYILVGLTTMNAMAASSHTCVPAESVICILDIQYQVADINRCYPEYALTTTFQKVRGINAASSCGVDHKKALKAYTTLKILGENLVSHNVCAVLVDNIGD